MLTRTAVASLLLAASSCGSPAAPAPEEHQASTELRTESGGQPIVIRTMAGEPEQEVFLVEPLKYVSRDDLAGGMRESGFPCERVTMFKQLQQNGERMDIYKLDCLAREYQLTFVNGNTHIKPWTGNMFGQ